MFLWANYRYYLLPLLVGSAQLTFAQFKTSPMLGERVPESVRKQTPTFIFGEP